MGDLVERAAEVIDALEPFALEVRDVQRGWLAKEIAQALSDAGMLAEGWRPIAEAPKDGTWIQGLYPDDPWAPVWTVRCQEWRYDGDSGENWYGDHHSSDTATDRDRPTAWRPLPTPPEDA